MKRFVKYFYIYNHIALLDKEINEYAEKNNLLIISASLIENKALVVFEREE